MRRFPTRRWPEWAPLSSTHWRQAARAGVGWARAEGARARAAAWTATGDQAGAEEAAGGAGWAVGVAHEVAHCIATGLASTRDGARGTDECVPRRRVSTSPCSTTQYRSHRTCHRRSMASCWGSMLSHRGMCSSAIPRQRDRKSCHPSTEASRRQRCPLARRPATGTRRRRIRIAASSWRPCDAIDLLLSAGCATSSISAVGTRWRRVGERILKNMVESKCSTPTKRKAEPLGAF